MFEDMLVLGDNDKSLGMMQISSDCEVVGKIAKATLGVSRMFGYNEDELVAGNSPF